MAGESIPAAAGGRTIRTTRRTRRKLFAMLDSFKSWHVFAAMDETVAQFQDFFEEALMLVSNLLFVVLMLVGFRTMPTPLMLLIALVGVGGPMLLASLASLLLGASWTTSIDFGPWLVEFIIETFLFLLGLACTSPSVTILAMAAIAFLSSQLFQTIGRAAGLDANRDMQVGWRDCAIFLIRFLKARFGDNVAFRAGLASMHFVANKQLRAIKQNEQILERMERIEAMMLAQGAPDLRAAQSRLVEDVLHSDEYDAIYDGDLVESIVARHNDADKGKKENATRATVAPIFAAPAAASRRDEPATWPAKAGGDEAKRPLVA